eukprot:NODE_645_length_2017_cov_39.093496_g596_i0.p1 GENE.NODE_645_length_2017_cov_39.093496_g596_i0~~NODE_645_length_2017_cov_39.093496_g596_i0.p1  ORF type:complete len:597 (-),score=146.91 NODE_645_length_2017_cov_39.093496_g596_i0:146-1936(-)
MVESNFSFSFAKFEDGTADPDEDSSASRELFALFGSVERQLSDGGEFELCWLGLRDMTLEQFTDINHTEPQESISLQSAEVHEDPEDRRVFTLLSQSGGRSVFRGTTVSSASLWTSILKETIRSGTKVEPMQYPVPPAPPPRSSSSALDVPVESPAARDVSAEAQQQQQQQQLQQRLEALEVAYGRLKAENDELRHIAASLLTEVPQSEEIFGNRRPDNVPPPMGQVTLIFTDVQSSTVLWERETDAMEEAIRLHNSRMRDIVEACNGYEVKTEGDAFMLAFSDPGDALRCCLDAQMELLNLGWPRPLMRLDDCAVQYDRWQSLLWSGLRVRMGGHVGEPLCKPDPVTGRMDYFGPVVNKAARVAGKARGGEILLSSEIMGIVQGNAPSLVASADWRCFGSFALKGISAPCTLYSLLPAALAERRLQLEDLPPTRMSMSGPTSDGCADEKCEDENQGNFFEKTRRVGAGAARVFKLMNVLNQESKEREARVEAVQRDCEQFKAMKDDLVQENAQLADDLWCCRERERMLREGILELERTKEAQHARNIKEWEMRCKRLEEEVMQSRAESDAFRHCHTVQLSPLPLNLSPRGPSRYR